MTEKKKREDGEDIGRKNEKKLKAQNARENSSPLDNGGGPNNNVQTPLKRRRGRPPGSTKKSKTISDDIGQDFGSRTTKTNPEDKQLFATPKKRQGIGENDIISPSPLVRNVERSAKRKSARTLIQRTIADDLNDGSDLDEEDALARTIWDPDNSSNSDVDSQADLEDKLVDEPGPKTPSKRGPKQYKKTRRKRTQTPPSDLPPHELYFFHNRPGNAKTSNNKLSSLSLLTHEQYFNEISSYKDPHASSLTFLRSLHSRSFPQWSFELSQSFSVCLYGYGSKRHLVNSFASYLHSLRPPSEPPKIAIVNGYILTLTSRQILLTLASLVFPSPLPALPAQPREFATSILTQLNTNVQSSPIYVFINSLDAGPLQRAPFPSILADLASSPHIHLLATCDTPTFPLLWDTPMREQLNFVFHDATTFESYGGAEIPSVIDEVNALLGRSGRSIKGKEGVGFVLRSLTENARNLYRMLIGELLASLDDDETMHAVEPEEGAEAEAEAGPFAKPPKRKQDLSSGARIEYTVLYQKAVEDFVCSNEMGFRGLLREFFDHEMLVSKRDGAGTEMLGVPFRREEMEAILEDLMG